MKYITPTVIPEYMNFTTCSEDSLCSLYILSCILVMKLECLTLKEEHIESVSEQGAEENI
jgi:hypothetical protein